jgi:hypothetical protein
MPHCSDPYIDDPYFREPSIVDRYGVPIGRAKFNQRRQSRAWMLAILGIAAILLIGALAYGPSGWESHKTGPAVAESPTTIGQAR